VNALVLAALSLAAQDAAPPPAAPPAKELTTPKSGSLSIGSAHVNGKVFDVSVGACARPKGAPADTPAECAITVTAKKGGSGKHKLEWSAKAGGVFQQSDHSVAIGDEADSAMAVTWWPVTVAKGIDGLIVSQVSGDPRKHRHDVLLMVGGKLRQVFTARDGRGPVTWSSITAIDVDGNKFHELVLMNASRPDEEEADNWELSVWAWRPDAGKVVKMPSWSPTVHAATVGMYATVKEALARGDVRGGVPGADRPRR
jgi:hypothetical protein